MLWMMERAGKKNSNNASFQLWQQHNQPIELSTIEMLRQKLDYIHHNPTSGKWTLAKDFLSYAHSSALFYEESVCIYDKLMRIEDVL